MKKLPKILLLTLEYPPQVGGVGRYYDGLVKHWPEEIKVVVAKLWWPLWPHWLALLWSVGRLVRREKIQMLWAGQVLPLGYVAWWLKKRKKIPYIVFTHGMDILLPQKSWRKKMWLKKILADADLVVANSEFTRGELIKLGVEEGRTVVVYPCPAGPLDNRHPELVSGSKNHFLSEGGEMPKQVRHDHTETPQKIILSVGRLVKRKGFDQVIEIMPRILKRIPEAKYVIIGNGPERDHLQLSDQVMILDNVSDEELVKWYNKCNVFAMPCRQIGADVEGFGMVFLEAALAGKPVIAGNSGGAPEATRHGYGGFVVDSESAEELYQALIKFLTDDNFAKRMGEYGKQWVERNFQWEREIQKLKDVILTPPQRGKDPVT